MRCDHRNFYRRIDWMFALQLLGAIVGGILLGIVAIVIVFLIAGQTL